MLENKTLLLFSSSPLTCHFFESLEHKCTGCTVKVAKSFDEGKEYLNAMDIDMVIIDTKSPLIKAEKVISYVKSQVEYVFKPLLIISDRLKKSFVRQMLQLGVSDFLAEPFEVDECTARMEMAMQSEAQRQKIEELSPQNLVAKGGAAKTLKKVHAISDTLIRALKKSKETANTLALVCIKLEDENALDPGEIEKDLASQMRPQDTLLRKGPCHFLVVLENTSERACQLIAENLLESIEMSKKKQMESSVKVGIGVSFLENTSFDRPETEMAILMEKLACDNLQSSMDSGEITISKCELFKEQL